MKIIKILNNNTALVDDGGVEKIAMGRGLGFGKKISDTLEREKIEKIYVTEGTHLGDLLGEIQPELLSISDVIVTKAREHLTSSLSDLVFVTIADHLSGAIRCHEQGVYNKNFLLWDTKKFFKKEFEIGLYAIDKIEKELGVSLPEDEAGFIALHLVNAELGNENSAATNLTRLMEEILTIIKYSFKISFDENDIYFQRFMTHLKFFSERILSQNMITTDANDEEMLKMIQAKYPESDEATGKIVEFIKNQYDYEVSRDEQLYLMIHLTRIVGRK